MRREELVRNILKHHLAMLSKLKGIDIDKLYKDKSEKQLDKIEKTLEELDGYALVHVKVNKPGK